MFAFSAILPHIGKLTIYPGIQAVLTPLEKGLALNIDVSFKILRDGTFCYRDFI